MAKDKKVLITGVSRGLGKALAEKFLTEDYSVYGIGRSANISHPNFTLLPLDLSHHQSVENFQFPVFETGEITFINNAGIVGEIKRISEMDEDCAGTVLQINTIAPIQLTRKLAKICGDEIPFTLVNISSGAGKRPIPAWAIYCASKAALDLFSETFYLEEKELGRNTKVYSIAPGVVDTEMQQKIRSSSEKDFSSLQNFKDLKDNNELTSASEAAEKLLKLLQKPYDGEVICSLKDS